MDLGVVPGTEIVNEMKSAGGDPIAYRVKEATVALRINAKYVLFITSGT